MESLVNRWEFSIGVLRETAHVAPREIETAIPGDTIETDFGQVHKIAICLEPHHCHGRVPVAGALTVKSELAATLALDPTLDGVDLSRMLLVDTETTGLNRGAGTLAFLVGIAFFEDQSLQVEQLLLSRINQEPAMLRYLAERIARARLCS